MIDNETYDEILASGLILDHWLVLCNIKNGVKLHTNRRIQGFVNLLTKKGYIENDELTEKGLILVQSCSFADVVKDPNNSNKDEDFNKWTTALYVKCQDQLLKMSGSRQVRDKIDGKAYNFLPNSVDFAKVLFRVIKLYKLNDREKIEKALMAYIERCARANNWFPILQYYIMKNNSSQMVTDIESMDDSKEEGEYKSTQKFV